MKAIENMSMVVRRKGWDRHKYGVHRQGVGAGHPEREGRERKFFHYYCLILVVSISELPSLEEPHL